jgi:plastocyanin
MRRAVLALLITPLLALVLAACSDDGSSESNEQHMGEENAPVVEGARVIEVDGSSFEFDPDEIRIGAGEDVTIEMTSSGAFHDFQVEDHAHVVGADPGDTAMGGLRIDEPGEYTFYCSVAGHRSSGMEGTIVVE